MLYQFEASDYMYTYILSSENCVGNCGAYVKIFMVQGGMHKMGQFIVNALHHWYTCCTYIHTYYKYTSTY